MNGFFSRAAVIRCCLLLLAGIILLALVGPFFTGYAPNDNQFSALEGPGAKHWFGTDMNGRDVFTRTLYGARISLLVGCVGALVSFGIGVCYGVISGYAGGRTDAVMMRFVDILYSLPRLILVIFLIAVFDEQVKGLLQQMGWQNLEAKSRLILLFAGLGMVEWLTMARIVRGQVLTLRERTYIEAARVLGQKPWKIMVWHLLPNLAGIILVYLTLTIPAVILEESFLSFLGLGVKAPDASWGTLLAEGAGFINPIRVSWWLLAGPGLYMALTLLALNFLGDALRDHYDPKMRK
jgi:peptide/nickel transport system permease protein/oligopeptide transport system permease protein